MRYTNAPVILVSLVLLTQSATANVLSAGDYDNFRNLDLRMLSIGDDIYGARDQSTRNACAGLRD